MPRKKKTESAPAPAAPVAEAEVKEEVVETPAPEVVPAAPVKKAPAKRTAAKNAPVEKAAPAEKKTSAAKKVSAPEKAEELFIEFDGKKYNYSDIIEKCKAAYKDGSRKQIKSISVYVNTNDSKAYYVVNGKADGSFVEL